MSLIAQYRKNAGRLHSVRVFGRLGPEATIRETYEFEGRLYKLTFEFRETFSTPRFKGKDVSNIIGKFVPEGYLFICNWDIGRENWHNRELPLISDAEVASVVAFFNDRGIDVAYGG